MKSLRVTFQMKPTERYSSVFLSVYGTRRLYLLFISVDEILFGGNFFVW